MVGFENVIFDRLWK